MAAAGPRISVLVPVFNRRIIVGDAIRSALSQTVDGLEIIVVDNHSDDGTWESLQDYKDSRLRIFRNESNVGLFGNFDRCGAKAQGDYCLFLCSDDQLAPGFLDQALRDMREHPSAVLYASRGHITDAAGAVKRTIADRYAPGLYEGRSVLPAWFWTTYHYGDNPLNYPSGLLLRTSTLKECLPFRTQFGVVADIDMFLRILRAGDLLVTNAVGCSVMQHDQQASNSARTSSALMHDHLALLSEYKNELESFGVYKTIRTQVACLELSAALRRAKIDPRSSIELLKGLGRKPASALSAVLKSAALIGMDKTFGYRRTRYLKSASAA
jgi:glycosyltransferase involved in cell wall biosynthesis